MEENQLTPPQGCGWAVYTSPTRTAQTPKDKSPKDSTVCKDNVILLNYTSHSLAHLTRGPKGWQAIKDLAVGKIRKGQRKLRNGLGKQW